MPVTQQTFSPVNGELYAERTYADAKTIEETLIRAQKAQQAWKQVPIAERAAFCRAATEAFVAKTEVLAEELSWQMGRPIAFAASEMRGFADRSRYMVDIAAHKLADIMLPEQSNVTRWLRREPLGVVFSVVPWNYPYLTAVNSIIPAIMAGNSVILKHSAQTPLCAERIAEAFAEAGLPEGVFQFLHLTHDDTTQLIRTAPINFVAFTGSVEGGRVIEQAASGRFLGVGLELGGKDPAYVRADVDIHHAATNLVDGAFFNTGQACCGIERIYVHDTVYDAFVEQFVELTRGYVLGNPLEQKTTLGPMVRLQGAAWVRQQIAEAVAEGATACIDPKAFPADEPNSRYVAPQVLLNVNHDMSVMREESFGPVVGIMKVSSDAEAVQLMNDSPYGLTASIWTQDSVAAAELGDQIATGTLYMNRCDYLEPALAWTGVKHSGRGCTLSEVGYEVLTRPKSFYLRTTSA